MYTGRKDKNEPYYALRLFNGFWQVETHIEMGLPFDHNNYVMGNYFRNERDAKEAMEKVKNFMGNEL